MGGSINWVPLIALGAVPILVLAALLPRMLRQPPPSDRPDAPAGAAPLRRARAAAEALTPAERVQFLRWLGRRWPAPPADPHFTPPPRPGPDERITP